MIQDEEYNQYKQVKQKIIEQLDRMQNVKDKIKHLEKTSSLLSERTSIQRLGKISH